MVELAKDLLNKWQCKEWGEAENTTEADQNREMAATHAWARRTLHHHTKKAVTNPHPTTLTAAHPTM